MRQPVPAAPATGRGYSIRHLRPWYFFKVLLPGIAANRPVPPEDVSVKMDLREPSGLPGVLRVPCDKFRLLLSD